MIRICFVCLGNICRSPMAEFIMKDKVKKLNKENMFLIESRATSYEEDGNDMYYKAREVLDLNNISYTRHRSTRLEISDFEKFDLFVCMDDNNVLDVYRIFNTKSNKVIKLLDRNISDPWYTRDFTTTYNDLIEGIDIFLKKCLKEK